jgi:hypothetical protein
MGVAQRLVLLSRWNLPQSMRKRSIGMSEKNFPELEVRKTYYSIVFIALQE